MSWLRLHQRSAWIIGLTLLVPVVLYFNMLFSLLGMRQSYQSDIDSLEPRVARLRGLVAYEEQLRSAANSSERIFNFMRQPSHHHSKRLLTFELIFFAHKARNSIDAINLDKHHIGLIYLEYHALQGHIHQGLDLLNVEYHLAQGKMRVVVKTVVNVIGQLYR